MKLLSVLHEATVTSDEDRPSSVEKRIDQAAEDSPEKLIDLIRTLAQSGHIDKETLDELKQVHTMIGKVFQAAKSGKIEVEKPRAGSFYSDQKARSEEPADKNFQAILRRAEYAMKKRDPGLTKQMNTIVAQEMMRRKEEDRDEGI